MDRTIFSFAPHLLKHTGQGLLVIVQYCYLPKQDKTAKITEDLILKYNPKWAHAGGNGLYPSQIDQVNPLTPSPLLPPTRTHKQVTLQGGMEFIEQFSYDYMQSFTIESWRGRIRTCNGVGSGGVLTEDESQAFDKELDRRLKKELGVGKEEKEFGVKHRLWCIVVKVNPSSSWGKARL